MLGIALACLLATSSSPVVIEGGVLPEGIHASATLIDAQQLFDDLPAQLASPDVARAPAVTLAPLTIREESVVAVRAALRLAGVYRIPYRYRDGSEVAYFSDRKHGPPREKLPYRVYFARVRHMEVDLASEILLRGIEREERDLDETLRTRLVADPRTSRLLVRARSKERFLEIRNRLQRIDVPPDPEATVELHTWIPRSKPARALIEEFREHWGDPVHSTLTVHEAKSAHALLFRATPGEWSRARGILERLDPRKQ